MRQKDNMLNPWAGLSSYEDPARSSRRLKFCGRDSDTFDVTRLIDDNFFVTLYGKSGIGKTSLLNAGVFPALRREQYTPLSLRLGMTENFQSFQDVITAAVERAVEEAGGRVYVIPVIEAQTDSTAIDYLWNWFACRRFLNADGQTTFPVVVFDQFEEVFRQSELRAKTEVLLAQLHYLIDESHAIGDCIVAGEEYTYDFNFRFVLSIREDDLYRLEDSIDNCALTALKRCRYRLRGLSEQGARAAILVPGEGLFRPEEQDQIVQTIIGIARNKEDQSISTNLLSLVCNRIFVDFQKKTDADYITKSLVDTFVKGNPFERFYEEATKGFSNKEKSYIEEHLVDSTGRRNSMPESDFLLHVPDGAKLLEGNARILQRSSVSTDGGNYRIELIHDSFCEPVSRQREKREKRKRIRQIALISVTALLLISGAAYIIHSMSERERKMLVNQSRFLSEKVSMLVDDGDSYMAKLLALEALPKDLNHPDRPYTIEAEIALRKAAQSNCAILRGHEWSVNFVSYSSDGKRIVSGSGDHTVRIWDAKTGIEINYFNLRKKDGAESWIRDAALSPDNRYLASFSNDSIIHVWDLKTAEDNLSNEGYDLAYNEAINEGNDFFDFFDHDITEIKSIVGHAGEIQSVNYSPDGTKIVSTAEDGTLRVWDAKTGKELMRHQYSDSHRSIGFYDYFTLASFTPDGKKIVAASLFDNTIVILDTKTGKLLNSWRFYHGTRSLDISPNGKRMVICSADGPTISLWDVEKGNEEIFHFPCPGSSFDLCATRFSPDGKQVVISIEETIYVWDSKTGEQLHKFKGHTGHVNSVAFSPDGKQIVSASGDQTIRIWDVEQRIILKNADGHDIRTRTANYNLDGTLVASSGYDAESEKSLFYLWDPKTCKIVREMGDCHDYLRFTSFSRNGELVAFPLNDKTIRVCDVKTGKTVSTFRGQIDAWYLFSIDFSPDGERIVSASSEGIRVWNVKSGKELFVIKGDGDHMIESAVFSPDGELIVSVSYNRIEIWDANTGKRKDCLYGHDEVNSAFFSPDGKLIVSASDDRSISIWDVETGMERKILKGHTKGVYSATFSPDGKYVVSASEDGTVRVWDVESGKQVQIYNIDETEFIYDPSVSFSPDGRQILFSATNCPARICDFPPLQDLIDQTRERFKDRKLTPEERKRFYLD